jgi:hypothetical protein
MADRDPRFTRSGTASRPYQQTPSGGDRPLEAGEHDAVSTIRPGPFPMGPRGRDAGGFPTIIPVGVPPAVAGSRHAEVPKDLRFPRIPPEVQHWPSIPIAANTGDIISEGTGFPVHTIWVNNYSSVWVYVDSGNVWLPPWYIGAILALSRAATTLRLTAAAPAGFTQPSLTTGGFLSVIASEDDRIPAAPGILLPTGVHP